MRAITLPRYGEPELLRLADIEAPALGPQDLRIAVCAAALNPIDAKIRSGGQRGVIRPKMPAVIGMDLSGVVTEVGAAVTGFSVGDEVFSSPHHRRMGCYAEEAVVAAKECALKPQNLSHEEAAGIPLVGLTAQNCLDACRLQPGQRILIQAGSGGLGSIAIQLAKHRGAEVLATCSTKNVNLVRELGADRVIDYTQESYEDVAKGVDAVLDALGGEHLLGALRTVRRGGRIAAVTMNLPQYTKRFGPYLGPGAMALGFGARMLQAKLQYGVSLRPIARRPDGDVLKQLGKLVEQGALRPVVDRILPLEDAAEAHRYLETGRARGKVILRIRE